MYCAFLTCLSVARRAAGTPRARGAGRAPPAPARAGGPGALPGARSISSGACARRVTRGCVRSLYLRKKFPHEDCYAEHVARAH